MKKVKIFLLVIGLICLPAVCGGGLYFITKTTKDSGGITAELYNEEITIKYVNREYQDSMSYALTEHYNPKKGHNYENK